jgi:hypothetical protein
MEQALAILSQPTPSLVLDHKQLTVRWAEILMPSLDTLVFLTQEIAG